MDQRFPDGTDQKQRNPVKNKNFEYRRQAAKKYAKTWHCASKLSSRGNYIYHYYDPDNLKSEGWWDDVSFMVGSQVVVVAWVHPRMKYSDETSEAAYSLAEPSPSSNFLLDSTPIYKKKGKNKNRKKIVAYECKPSGQELKEWHDKLQTIRDAVRKTSDIRIKPSITIEQLDYCRFVELCIPVEVIDQKSLEDMTDLARLIIKDRGMLDVLYPGYEYGKEQWIAEGHDGRLA